MRIAIITERFPPSLGGAEVRYFEIAKRLAEWGNEVHVYAISEGQMGGVEYPQNLNVHRVIRIGDYFNQKGTRSIRNIFAVTLAMYRKLVRQTFDVYDFNQFPFLPAIFIKKHPSIVTWLEVWHREAIRYAGGILCHPIRILERKLTTVADYHLAISNLTRNRLVENYNVPPEKIGIIPCGVDYDALKEGSHKKIFGRICYIGRLPPHKHIEVVIDAYSVLRKEFPEVELHIVTVPNDPCLHYYGELLSQVRGAYVYGAPRSVALNVLKSSYIFASASEREGFGMAALEAMASGTVPVVAESPLSAVKETIVNNRTGIVAKPLPECFASAIRNLLEDKNRWKDLSRNGREHSKNYDWDVIATKAKRTYMQVAQMYGD